MDISLVAEPVIDFLGFKITNSLLTSLIISIGLIIFCLIFSSKKLNIIPGGRSLQNILETIIETLLGLFQTAAGEKTRLFFPLAATFFVYIILGNWIGLLPGVGSIGIYEVIHGEKILVPLFRGATADINTTLALAIISVAAIQFYGLRNVGFSYLKKFFHFGNPINSFVGFLELLSEFSKIISFAFRLFGNIFAGEVLLSVMAFLLPFILPIPFLGLELFVGLIQAIVFVMLTLVFLKVATESHH